MLEVLGKVKEGVEEDGAEVALLKVRETDLVGESRSNHIKALAEAVF